MRVEEPRLLVLRVEELGLLQLMRVEEPSLLALRFEEPGLLQFGEGWSATPTQGMRVLAGM
jgi:hypothetical protein